ncbi:MAG: RHS repeat protein [Burkholderiales bacterium]|nr:RHS repeat protein [Burkholderiales bacterium]
MLGSSVFGHSGEFGPSRTDLSLPGRGLHFAFVRSYRSSLADRAGELGRGWTASIAKRVEAAGDDLLVHDGTGLAHRFAREGRGFASPPGYYGIIAVEPGGIVLRHRYGVVTTFEAASRGGRIRSVADRHGNALTFAYGGDRIEILDTLERRIDVALAKGRIQEVRDHAGRIWTYRYDAEERLVEVVQPATRSAPARTLLRYGYDNANRLQSMTDAKGQTWLVVRYDDAGRVVEQTHGSGTYTFAYDTEGRGRSSVARITCRLKNGGTLVVTHDPAGHPVLRTLRVRRDAFVPEDVAGIADDTVPVITTISYNRHGERVSRKAPAGDLTTWVFAADDPDPRNRGNCLIRTVTPAAGVSAAQASLVTTWKYDKTFQVPLSVTDPRGSTTTYRYDPKGDRVGTTFAPFTHQPVGTDGADRPTPVKLTLEATYAYNSRGQLIRKKHIDGSETTFEYYPVSDPSGRGGPGTATADPNAICGYLARVTRDANGARRQTSYRWDNYGTLAEVLDGQRNAVRLRYDAMGRLKRLDGRGPGAWIEYRYDENGNEIESIQPFERLGADADSGRFVTRAGTIRELRTYDLLDRIVTRTIAGDDMRITERFVRDADERLVRLVQPTGAVTEIEYDERDLPIASTRAAGTGRAITERRAYTMNGDLRSETDGRAGTTLHHFDGFGRHVLTIDRLGTRWARELDAGDNAVRVVVKSRGDRGAPFIESTISYDEWDRPVRIDKAWRDASGRALGASGWDGREGVSSTVVEYAANGRPGRIWNEGGNVVAVDYDSLGQVAVIGDSTGERAELAYDVNGNPTTLSLRVPVPGGDEKWSTVRARYDEMDRLVSRQVDDDAPEGFAHDTLGGVNDHRRSTGLEVRLLHDPLGRKVGQAFVVADAGDGSAASISRRFEYDDTYRLTAHTDGAGNRTTYRYDTLGRQVGIVYPNGALAIAEHDANGNIVRTVDPRGVEIVLRYDAADRIVERRTRGAGTDATTEIESFEYDAVGRLVRATTPTGELRRTHDSLSRLLTEQFAGRTLSITYDAAGRPAALDYPGGERIRRTFDVRGRVVAVNTATGEPIASVAYRAGEQVARLTLGDVLDATCDYDRQGRLASVRYVRREDGSLVEGFRYAYDDADRVVYEVQLSDGVGERYEFDAANRPVRARYGIRDVLDPASPFEVETVYEHFPEGPWRRRRDLDSRGVVIADQRGTIDERNRYRRFGGTSFVNDAAGNTVRKGTDNPGFWLYTYDALGRLTKAERFDVNGRRIQTIEYEYDALGRQVRKTVTDRDGAATVTEYVWSGSTLLEEYENGVLVRTYVYGIATDPARLTVDRGGRADYWYLHNGRGLAAGLVKASDPNSFAERYGYEITGFSFMKEIGGIKVDLPERPDRASSLWNSVLAGDAFGTLSRDWASGTVTGPGGRHLDPLIAAALNMSATIGGGTHGTLKMTLGKQFESFLGMLGLGGRSNGFISRGGTGGKGSKDTAGASSSLGGAEKGSSSGAATGGGQGIGLSRMARDFALYAAGSLFPSSGQNPAFDFTKGGGGSSGTSGGSSGESTGFMSSPGGEVLSGILTGIGTGLQSQISGGPPKGDPPPGSPSSSGSGEKKPTSAEQEKAWKERQEKEAKEKEAKEREAREKEAKEKEAKEKEAKEKGEKGKDSKDAEEKDETDDKKDKGTTYGDPDQQYQSAIVTTPEQLEMRLNGRKQPVDPNAGGGGWEIDTSSPPPNHGGLDPTVVRFDGETFGGLTLEGGEPKFPIGPVRYVRDYEPPQPPHPPNGGGENEHDLGIP